MRADRRPDELRPVSLVTGVQSYPAGSCEVTFGATRVLCAASVEEDVPRWMRGSGRGWVTAEYAMLPSATAERTPRESLRGQVKGRTHEIQRLIGRSLRSVVDLKSIGELSVVVDCDVIQADGGTRTASITGAWVALALALRRAHADGRLTREPLLQPVAAVSVGIVDGTALLDLDYAEDVAAQVDMNVVMAPGGRYVEVQGTAEGEPFDRAQLDALLALGVLGCDALLEMQAAVLEAEV